MCYEAVMKKLFVLSFAILIVSAATSYAGPECTCRYKGNKIPEGQSTCLKTADGYKIAQCSRVLNNTSWKFTKQKCPIG